MCPLPLTAPWLPPFSETCNRQRARLPALGKPGLRAPGGACFLPQLPAKEPLPQFSPRPPHSPLGLERYHTAWHSRHGTQAPPILHAATPAPPPQLRARPRPLPQKRSLEVPLTANHKTSHSFLRLPYLLADPTSAKLRPYLIRPLRVESVRCSQKSSLRHIPLALNNHCSGTLRPKDGSRSLINGAAYN